MRKMLRDWFREERAKLSEMDFKQAVRYIRHYYWMWILAILGGIAGIIYLLVLLFRGAPEYHLYAVFADTRARAGNNSRIWRDFTEFSGWDLSQKQVEFNAAVYFDYIKDQGRGNTYYNSFITWADTGTLDLITMDPQQIAALGQSGRLLDWDLERCAALREKYADRLIWYEPPEDAPEQTGPVPVGIDVSDSLLVTKYGLYPEACGLGIGAGSTRLDAVGVFLDFIFSAEE